MAKRRIKIWGRMNLYETSVVGIPAYPDAHSSVESFSLVKSLSNANTKFAEEAEDISEELNLEEKEETMEETSQTKSETIEVAKTTEIVEVKSETKEEVKTAEVDMSEIIAKAIKEGIKDGLKELEIERGVVEKQSPVKKSLGELAIEQGLFVMR